MKTIKVIDLLNKIANEEEVPEYIQYTNHNELDTKDIMLVCKENLFYKLDQLEICLNDEVEIIEEDKEIEEINVWYEFDGKNNDEIIYFMCTELKDKINELVKAVNELKKGK